MSPNTNLLTPEQKETLLNHLDSHIKGSGFYKKIEEKLDSLKLDGKSNIEQVYSEIYKYMTDNMPQEVQDAFFLDIKRVIAQNKQ